MRLVGTFILGSASLVAVAVAAAWVSSAFVPTPADAARVEPELRMQPAAPAPFAVEVEDVPVAAPLYSVTDIRNFYSSGEIAQPKDWLFRHEIMPVRPTVMAALPVPAPDAPSAAAPSVETVVTVPLPPTKPLFAGGVTPGDSAEDELSLAPLPPKKPDAPVQMAMLPPSLPEDEAPEAAPETPAETQPLAKDELRYPTPEDRFAVYDIKARKLYLPNGKKLEAHSGYGDKFDDVRYVHVKMYGPTPPNRYKLRMREALFHGTEAVRLLPVGDGKMYGRTGFLLHPYLLGPRGDSNGCISLADYDAFLAAFKKGEVQEVIVVEAMPKSAEPVSPLISWLTGKKS
ncbi:DUF2778 domain-containing protein [Ancylobacter sp. SL191]|jgi:hypothetical protein|uniref:DUF2778 domain-containing protein n=1 Tax=Ancylobacter sp. SL191 TaxID=2995166 RepID=UPI002271D75C|nr:DUF2778 domain-containing protein [Ancylobacter sp. SL191]WAC27968.1 DUF2778 domain-containing protein [Ancylobacter sp. SL191]